MGFRSRNWWRRYRECDVRRQSVVRRACFLQCTQEVRLWHPEIPCNVYVRRCVFPVGLWCSDVLFSPGEPFTTKDPGIGRPIWGAQCQFCIIFMASKIRCFMGCSTQKRKSALWRLRGRPLSRLVRQFFQQDDAAFYSVELVLIGSIACIGLVVGLAEYRNSLVQEYGDVSGAIAHLDQSFSFTLTASSGGAASTSAYSDTMVYAGGDANGITVTTPPAPDSE